MAKQKARARNAAQVENGDWVVLREGEQEFVGYDHTEYPCHILRYREVKQKKSTFFEVVLDYTPFYGEMGGQVGDQGKLVSSDETVVVSDTKRENNQSIHILKRMPQDPRRSLRPASMCRCARLPPATTPPPTSWTTP